MIRINDLIDFKNLEYNWAAIEAVPTFAMLKNCEQSPKWHKEGNAFIHTKMVCQVAINMCQKYFSSYESDKFYVDRLLTAALFHDVGKTTTTHMGKDGNWHSYQHEEESEKITRLLLWDEGYEFREDVCALVRWHMEPLNIYDRKDYLEHIVYLSKRIPSWDLLIKLKQCDLEGSIQEDEQGKICDRIKLNKLYNLTGSMQCLYGPSNIDLKGNFAHEIYKEYSTKPNIKAYVLIGLPGAGKSTAIENIVKDIPSDKEYIVISRDLIRAELGFCKEGGKIIGSEEQEHKVTVNFNQKLMKAAEEGKIIIIDNINLKRMYRSGYKTLLSDFYVNWVYVYVEADSLSKNIERRDGQIPSNAYNNMIMNFDWPSPSEYTSMGYYIN